MSPTFPSDTGEVSPCLIHVPHTRTAIPDEWRHLFLLNDDALQAALLRATDTDTDDLFALDGIPQLVFPVSRLLVDPERFANDADEVMAAVGLGAVYTHTWDGEPLKSAEVREALMERYYWPHHAQLDAWAQATLAAHGRGLLIDAHSFPTVPFRSELKPGSPRPDVCLGTAGDHTSPELLQAVRSALQEAGVSVEIDTPFAGTMVPNAVYGRSFRLQSLMIEIHRGRYMNEATGERSAGYAEVRRWVSLAVAAAWRVVFPERPFPGARTVS